MTRIKCRRCGKQLMKGDNVNAQIKCPRCGYIQIVQHESKKRLTSKKKEVKYPTLKNLHGEKLILAHPHSMKNREEIAKSNKCGCFHCGATFDAPELLEITGWLDGGQTAICPDCGVDSIIGDASLFPVEGGFLTAMQEYWF